MKIQKQREIVIEFEHVRLVRKKAKTHVLHCRECRREVDFIALREAATLFATDMTRLFGFVKTSFSHYKTGAGGDIYICLASFLAAMKTKTSVSQIKMIAD